MGTNEFTGIMPALVTPFDERGNLKAHTVERLVDWNLSKGVDGFYICGGTGEGPVLSTKLRMEMAEATVASCKHRGKIIDHIGAIAMDDAIALTRHATEIGVDAISSLPPTYYFHYSKKEIVSYYRTIADCTDKPVIVYATSMMGTIDLYSLMQELMEIPNVIGAKFTLPDYFLMHRLTRLNGGDTTIINGPDETLLCGLAMGASGGIGTTYNIMPDYFVNLYSAFKAGDIDLARSWQAKVDRIIEILIRHSTYGAIGAVKETLNAMGFDAGHTAPPSFPLDKETVATMVAELEKAGLDLSI
jgi:N-acetylneuraminate lyase